MKILNYAFHILLAGAFGTAVFFLLGQWIGRLGEVTELTAAVVETPKLSVASDLVKPDLVPIIPLPISTEKSIKVDLKAMKLMLYEGDQLIETIPVLSKGRPGLAWETPTGKYSIKTMEVTHFSSIGRVWMPYSMQFFGNFFIHGWPYYEGGEPVGEGYSGGCIRLATADAKRVFDFTKKGMTITVINGETITGGQTSKFTYLTKPDSALPSLSASAYLVADLESGQTILEKSIDKKLPLASITKLMTALVSLETISQTKQAVVSANALATYGEAGELKVGEQIKLQDLLYPLLLESSNDASEVIAESAGRHNFITNMNDRAKALGLTATSFADPSGISEKNVSTVSDIFKFTSYLYKDKSYLFSILKKKTATASGHLWTNILPFVDDSRYLGGKSGHTMAAGDTLATVFALPLAEFETRPIAIILLDSANREADTTIILNYLTGNIYYGEAEGEETITLSFVGDIMLDRGVAGITKRQYRGDYKTIFVGVPSLRSADILFGNLEGPLSDQGKEIGNLYSFRMSPEALPALTSAGFDVLSVANNHAGDWGREAFVDTLNKLAENQIVSVGGGKNKTEASTVKILERRGVRVGYLATSDVGPEWLSAGETSSGVMLANDDKFYEALTQASKEVDILVASYHFGDE
ncbi:MAG: CapA family protein, partial [Patescibacteria group bacterium]